MRHPGVLRPAIPVVCKLHNRLRRVLFGVIMLQLLTGETSVEAAINIAEKAVENITKFL